MAGTLDHVEDAIESLNRHESGYILIAVCGNEREALCASNNIHSLEHLRWLRRRFAQYEAQLRAKLKNT